MDKISIRANVLNKEHVLSHPEQYVNRNIIVFEARDEKYIDALRQFAKEWKGKLDNLVLALGFLPEKFEERAKNLFFAMRDEMAKTGGDTSRANKDSIYHGLVLACEFRHTDGRVKQSLKELDKRELWELIQHTERELHHENGAYEYMPYVNDLARDYTGGMK